MAGLLVSTPPMAKLSFQDVRCVIQDHTEPQIQAFLFWTKRSLRILRLNLVMRPQGVKWVVGNYRGFLTKMCLGMADKTLSVHTCCLKEAIFSRGYCLGSWKCRFCLFPNIYSWPPTPISLALVPGNYLGICTPDVPQIHSWAHGLLPSPSPGSQPEHQLFILKLLRNHLCSPSLTLTQQLRNSSMAGPPPWHAHLFLSSRTSHTSIFYACVSLDPWVSPKVQAVSFFWVNAHSFFLILNF